MILNYVYRIYPDKQQIDLFNEWLETCRVSYNFPNYGKRDAR
ncbi:MAG: helix-turn-helix domain-containing protein [Waterburya sp.]